MKLKQMFFLMSGVSCFVVSVHASQFSSRGTKIGASDVRNGKVWKNKFGGYSANLTTGGLVASDSNKDSWIERPGSFARERGNPENSNVLETLYREKIARAKAIKEQAIEHLAGIKDLGEIVSEYED